MKNFSLELINELERHYRSYNSQLALEHVIRFWSNKEPPFLRDEKYDEGKVVSTVQMLIENKADPNDCYTYGWGKYPPRWSYLELAVKSGHGGLVKLLLNAGVKGRYRGAQRGGGHDREDIIDRCLKQNVAPDNFAINMQALMAWRLFISIVQPDYYARQPQIRNCIWRVIDQQHIASFIFLKALSSFYINKRRHPIVTRLLQEFLYNPITQIVIEYSDDMERKPQEIESEILSMPHVWQPFLLKTTVPPRYFQSMLTSTHDSLIPVSLPDQPVIQVPLLMFAASSGEPKIVENLLHNKADPTASIHGNSALIWALQGKSLGHAQAAEMLSKSLDPEPPITGCAIL